MLVNRLSKFASYFVVTAFVVFIIVLASSFITAAVVLFCKLVLAKTINALIVFLLINASGVFCCIIAALLDKKSKQRANTES
jgi:hypothetical protein